MYVWNIAVAMYKSQHPHRILSIAPEHQQRLTLRAADAASSLNPMAVRLLSASASTALLPVPADGAAAAGAAAGSGSGSLKSASSMCANTHSMAASALELFTATAV